MQGIEVLHTPCVFCKADKSVFKDVLSIKEFTISGLCQKCQDAVFEHPSWHEPKDDFKQNEGKIDVEKEQRENLKKALDPELWAWLNEKEDKNGRT